MIPSSNQIASAMRQKTQNYDGDWDPGRATASSTCLPYSPRLTDPQRSLDLSIRAMEQMPTAEARLALIISG